jgi:hypothetical protein
MGVVVLGDAGSHAHPFQNTVAADALEAARHSLADLPEDRRVLPDMLQGVPVRIPEQQLRDMLPYSAECIGAFGQDAEDIKSLSVNNIYFLLVLWYRFSRMTSSVNGRNHGQYTVLGSLGYVLGKGGAADPSAGT